MMSQFAAEVSWKRVGGPSEASAEDNADDITQGNDNTDDNGDKPVNTGDENLEG